MANPKEDAFYIAVRQELERMRTSAELMSDIGFFVFVSGSFGLVALLVVWTWIFWPSLVRIFSS